MVLSGKWSASRSAAFGLVLLAAILAVSSVSADTRRKPLRIPPDARGYQTALLIQQHLQSPPSAPSTRASSGPRTYGSGGQPLTSAPRTVAIRGPDGRVRVFEVEANVQPRPIVVRQSSR